MNSLFLRLSKNDLVKGAVVAAFSAILGALYPVITTGAVLNIVVFKSAGLAGLSAGMAYLMKNLITNSEGKIGSPEPK